MNKRIGVITLYYKNLNYGGLLQAYALVKALEKIGVQAEQISFDRSKDRSPVLLSRKERFKSNPISFLNEFLQNRLNGLHYQINYKEKRAVLEDQFKKRGLAFKSFEERIPHTPVVDCQSIKELNYNFDGFICGSDQVWNPEQLRDAYLLTFADDNKIKCAYAASVGRDDLSENELNYIIDKIQSFDAISVREMQVCKLLEEKVKKEVKWVLDPTLLLDAEDWEKVMEPYRIEGSYILTYFLGDSVRQRAIVQKFAKEKELSIVSFPHIQGRYRKCDEHFADFDLYDVNPSQFLYLIRNAEYVITDSFHACVFSILLRKNFVVFGREDRMQQKKMNSRISSLLSLTNLEGQLVSEKTFDGIETIEYDDLDELRKRKEISYVFLKDALKLE